MKVILRIASLIDEVFDLIMGVELPIPAEQSIGRYSYLSIY